MVWSINIQYSPYMFVNPPIGSLIWNIQNWVYNAGLILGLHPVNEKRRYKVTPSLIGWLQT